MHELLTSWGVHPTHQLDKTNLIHPDALSWFSWVGVGILF